MCIRDSHKAFQKIIADFLLLHTAVQHTGAVKQELYNDVIGKRQIAFRANIEQYAVQGFIGLCYIDGGEGCLKALKDIAALTLIFRGQTLIIQKCLYFLLSVHYITEQSQQMHGLL